MWIMQLRGMVVIRKRSRKTNTYRVWRRMKALETIDLGKGQVFGEKMYEFVKEYLNRKVSPTSSYAQFTFVV
jgi:hypothetical protein